MNADRPPEPPTMTPEERAALDASRRGRNRVLGLVLAALAVLFFAITIAKMGLANGVTP